ncbi:MAG: tRNA lysidine(34) synthetase TilS [Thermodesulfobacteriota bacterium]
MKADRETVDKVRKTIAGHGMIRPGETVIVAVSGGPDSVCLLHILYCLRKELHMKLVVAHFDHGLRPHEDESETGLVRSLAASLNLPFETERSATDLGSAGSLEEEAREARYDFLERVRGLHSGRKIAVAHTLNDQAETFLMRLLRGSGPSGLSGIPPVRGGVIIRPLIEVSRREVETYLKVHGLPFAIDSSNVQAAHLRNRIRLELIPLLLEYQPRLVEHLAETADRMREDGEILDILAADWMEREAEMTPAGQITIPLAPFLAVPNALQKRITRHILRRVKGDLRRIGLVHIRSVENLARSERPQGSLHLPNRLRVTRVYDRLCFASPGEKRTLDFSYSMDGPGSLHLGEIDMTFTLVERENAGGTTTPVSPWSALLDAARVRFPLVIRTARPGDRFIPLGMKGHKKLKDFFVDLKVPLSRRRSTPLLCQGDVPIWVGGFRIDDRFKVTPSTQRTLEANLR